MTTTAPDTTVALPTSGRLTNPRATLSALWAATMFLFVYADIQGLILQPGSLATIQGGTIAGFEITQGWLLGVAVLMTVPALMVALPHLLPHRAARLSNIVAGIAYTLVTLVTMLTPGEEGFWAYYVFYNVVEITLTVSIVVIAWRWRAGARQRGRVSRSPARGDPQAP